MNARQTITVNPGDRFGRLTVLAEEYRPRQSNPAHRRRGARCRCDCGTVKWVRIVELASGHAVSCGCWRQDRLLQASVTHGLSSHPLYGTHQGMMQRCYDAKCRSFRHYGGRGITVCPQWHDVTVFIAWIEANLGPRPAGRTLDRIGNDGNYKPGNMRWATAREQLANRRTAAAQITEAGDPP